MRKRDRKKRLLKRIMKSSTCIAIAAVLSTTVYARFVEMNKIDAAIVAQEAEMINAQNELANIDMSNVMIEVIEDEPVIVVEAPKVEEVKVEEPKKEEKKEVKKTTTTKTTTSTAARSLATSRSWNAGVRETKPGVITTDDGKEIKYKKVIDVYATAYCACKHCCGKSPSHPAYGITAMGTKAAHGTVAVDPRVISLGSKLYIEGIGSTYDYGYSQALDTGRSIKGNKIDLYFESHSEALKWGKKKVRVYILDK